MNKGLLGKIYFEYFEIIDSYFGSIKHYLGEDEDSHIDLGIYIASYPLISDLIIDAIEDLGDEINSFWEKNAKAAISYIEKQKTLKCVYSGDISPVILESFVKKCGLYVDTVIIPDPITNLTLFQKQIILDKKYYLNKIVRHVFNIWKLKELVTADAPVNILAILPIGIHFIRRNTRVELIEAANQKFTGYINKITTRNFATSEEIVEHFQKIDSSNKIYEEIKNRDLVPKIFSSVSSLDDFLTEFSETDKYSIMKDKSFGWSFGLYIQSQFIRVQEHKYFCKKMCAEPIYDYDLPWFFFNYDVGGLYLDASIIRALQTDRFNWISNVPITALKIFREENKLDYMRNILRTGITDLKAKNDEYLVEVSEQVENNLKEAFKQQDSEIKALEKDVKKITKKEIPITTSGFLLGFIPYIGNIISLSTAGRDIKNHIETRKGKKQTLAQKKDDFINLLMKSYDEK